MLYNKQDPASIQSMFGTIAENYDRTNGVLSFQMHRLWNKRLIAAVVPRDKRISLTIADLCCGTGAITLPWLASQSAPQKVYCVDFCAEMLACAEAKAADLALYPRHALRFIHADVHSLPFEPSCMDCATMAYGIRNVASPAQCFTEVLRVLKNGGTFGILELTQPPNRFLRWGHHLYLQTALPALGKIFAKNEAAYQYLCDSIHAFVKPLELKTLLQETGFSSVEIRPLCGGIATLLIAKK